MARTSKQADSPKTADDIIAKMQKEGLGNLAELNTAVLESFGDMSTEMAKFIAQRIEEDVRVQHELLHCKSLNEAQQIQMNFLEQAFRQYQEGAARMLDIGTHALEAQTEK